MTSSIWHGAPKLKLNYSSPDRRLEQLLTVPALLAKLRYYGPRYCVSLMPTEREPERVERDRKFFKAGGIKELLGFEAMARPATSSPVIASLQATEAYLKFERVWGTAASNKFQQYSRVPVMQPDPAALKRVEQWLVENRKFPHRKLVAVAPYSNFPSKDIPEHTLIQGDSRPGQRR